MVEHVRQAIRHLGTRADALGTCAICGRRVLEHEERVLVWAGKYAHGSCATYRHGSRNSHRVHDSFTEA